MAKASRACVFLLRLLAAAATVSAAVVMATSHESTTLFGLTLEAKFQYTPSFKFFVIANAIGCGYSLLVLLIPPTSSLSRFVVMLDVIIAMLLTAAISAAGAISEVGKKGNSHSGWLPICGQIPKFCDHVKGAMICAFCGVVIYLVILLHSIHTVIGPLLP
ncbi:CASP-like protein 1C1 [Elaeis guineensis]|uniref:CASP-like protein n=1 Tax=Elaeis guineensis var. tenera TaxID=51953 RepID=A0A6I9R0G9_ELAGV|nr:CASP-like protein 1C1 [Elaeis guineensis]